MSVQEGAALDVTTPVEPLEPDRSLGEAFSKLGEDLGGLVSTQMELARAELSTEVRQAATAAGLFGAGSVLAYLALTLACFAAAWGLSEVMAEGLAFLVVAVVVALVAAVAVVIGRRKAEAAKQVAPETVETIREDVQWTREQMR